MNRMEEKKWIFFVVASIFFPHKLVKRESFGFFALISLKLFNHISGFAFLIFYCNNKFCNIFYFPAKTILMISFSLFFPNIFLQTRNEKTFLCRCEIFIFIQKCQIYPKRAGEKNKKKAIWSKWFCEMQVNNKISQKYPNRLPLHCAIHINEITKPFIQLFITPTNRLNQFYGLLC